jgi:hypothetical protein
MSKILKVKVDIKTKNSYFELNDFSDIVDVKQVKYYEVLALDNGTLSVKFYDENQKIIKPKSS